MPKDDIYSQPLTEIAGFRFDQRVVDVFPDMIQRSVPGYTSIISVTGTLANRYAQAGSNLYDLGCSLGASTFAMRDQIADRDCCIVAVDNSAPMLNRCQELLAQQPSGCEVALLNADICDIEIQNASMVVLNFTLQFVPIAKRGPLLTRIFEGLLPGGVLILSEKVSFEDDEHHRLMTDLHHHFKRAQGYSDLEVSQKRAALDNVLVPETLACHQKRLADAGFSVVDNWFQCFNFASLIARKR